MKFPSKKDPLLVGLLLTVSIFMIGQSIFILIRFTIASPVVAILVLVPSLIGILLLWQFFSTGWEITAEHLVAYSGLFRFRVPLERIVQVEPMRKLFVPLAWGFALSRDGVYVWYRKKNGDVARTPIDVSPQNKVGFIRELTRAVPNLQVEEE